MKPWNWQPLYGQVRYWLQEFYVAPYRRELARAQREHDQVLMLLVFSEAMGVPNPVSFYTLELLPLLYDDFHQWHQRQGMAHSPFDHFRCC